MAERRSLGSRLRSRRPGAAFSFSPCLASASRPSPSAHLLARLRWRGQESLGEVSSLASSSSLGARHAAQHHHSDSGPAVLHVGGLQDRVYSPPPSDISR